MGAFIQKYGPASAGQGPEFNVEWFKDYVKRAHKCGWENLVWPKVTALSPLGNELIRKGLFTQYMSGELPSPITAYTAAKVALENAVDKAQDAWYVEYAAFIEKHGEES